MATIASTVSRTSTKNLKEDVSLSKKEKLKTIGTINNLDEVTAADGLTKGKKYNFQEADEEVILPGKQGQFIKPTRIINQYEVKNMLAD